jgi:hypothetical protein
MMGQMTDESRLTWALVLSVLLHGLLLSLLPLVRRAQLQIPTPPLVDVDLVSLPKPAARPQAAAPVAPAAPAAPAPPAIPVPKQQIVSPPDAGEEKAPQNTHLLSDRDNTVKEESVHHGEPAEGNPEAKPQPPPAPKPAAPERRPQVAHRPAPEHVESATTSAKPAGLPKLDQLLAQPGDLMREGLEAEDSAPPTPAQQQLASNQRADLLRFGDLGRNTGLRSGTMDYLPSVHESDITLLNTKAERFAPFVRRVAVRVFQHLEIGLRQAATRRGVGGGREYAVVEAIMSKSGQLVSARIVERQSDSHLGADRELISAARPDVFFDANPPPGAEGNDGNIHFILLVDLMVQPVTDPRTGGLGAGYYGIAAVGLDSAPKTD